MDQATAQPATGANDGTIYLIHFDQRFGHAGHYLGWAKNLEARVAHHRKGTGARLLQVVNQAGIDWNVVKTWQGDRHLERRLKNRGGASRLCPACQAIAKGESVVH